jgi:hypothetical protein
MTVPARLRIEKETRMNIFTRSTVVFIMLGLASFAAAAQNNTPASTVGRWRLNVEKSDYGTSAKPKSGMLTITTDTAALLKWRAVVTNADGKKDTYYYSGAEDGQQHTLTGDNPWKSAAFTRGDSGVTDESVVMKDGTTLDNHISLSADGNTMTATASGGGTTEVWERVKASRPKAQ